MTILSKFHVVRNVPKIARTTMLDFNQNEDLDQLRTREIITHILF